MYPTGNRITSRRLKNWSTCTQMMQISNLLQNNKMFMALRRSRSGMISGRRERGKNFKTLEDIGYRNGLSSSVSNSGRWAGANSLHASLITAFTLSTPQFGSTSLRGAAYSSRTACPTPTTKITTWRINAANFRIEHPNAAKTEPIAELSCWATTKGK